MEKTLCLDFGNTRLKAAMFINGSFEKELVLPDAQVSTLKNLLSNFQPQKAILSSVINHNQEIEELLSSFCIFHKLTHHTKLNFTCPIKKPETIGADRLALAAAAVHCYPQKHNLIIGLGSCITYNFINQNNYFLGGSISPGMDMRFKALQSFTAKLPLVQKDWNFPLVGYDTKTNIQSGVLAGMVGEMEGFIKGYKQKFDNFNVVLTGGDALYFARRLKNKIFADSYFLFKGLYALSEINNIQ